MFGYMVSENGLKNKRREDKKRGRNRERGDRGTKRKRVRDTEKKRKGGEMGKERGYFLGL